MRKMPMRADLPNRPPSLGVLFCQNNGSLCVDVNHRTPSANLSCGGSSRSSSYARGPHGRFREPFAYDASFVRGGTKQTDGYGSCSSFVIYLYAR